MSKKWLPLLNFFFCQLLFYIKMACSSRVWNFLLCNMMMALLSYCVHQVSKVEKPEERKLFILFIIRSYSDQPLWNEIFLPFHLCVKCLFYTLSTQFLASKWSAQDIGFAWSKWATKVNFSQWHTLKVNQPNSDFAGDVLTNCRSVSSNKLQ